MNFKIYLAKQKPLQADRTLVMGILNATPDSFSDGGELADQRNIKSRIKSMIDAGADILDVGGESTRPGHKKVNVYEEIKRVIPIIKAIRGISSSIPISIDTQKAVVARAALEAGASLVNDVSALSDKQMAGILNHFGCSIIMMRNEATGPDVVAGCKGQFARLVEKAEKSGIEKRRILLDPGLGFGDLKTNNYRALPGSDLNANMLLIINIGKYSLDLPVVIGASRKRFIGELSGEKDPKQRLAGSLAAAVMAAQAGASILRVHDVAETVSVLKQLK